MSQITPRIYLGGLEHARDRAWLKSRGITHIVNATFDVPNFFPSDFSYIKLNLVDIHRQNIYPVLEKSYRFILRALNSGGRVYIHCVAGVSRSTSILIYFLMKIKGWDYFRSLEYIRSKRGIVNPNPGFEQQLKNVHMTLYPRKMI